MTGLSDLFDIISNSTLANQHASSLRGRVLGIQRGVVVNNGTGAKKPDPENRRRIKIMVPSKGVSESGWLECLNLLPYNDPPLPKVGATVFALFVDGNPHDGVWLGPSTNLKNPASQQDDPENDSSCTTPGDKADAISGNQYDLCQKDRTRETEGSVDELVEQDEFHRVEKDYEVSGGGSQKIYSDSGCEIFHAEEGFLYHRDARGAGLYSHQGAVLVQDRYGNQIVLGGINASLSSAGKLTTTESNSANSQFTTDFVIDLQGHNLEIVNAGSVKINGTEITTKPHTHPDSGGSATERGY